MTMQHDFLHDRRDMGGHCTLHACVPPRQGATGATPWFTVQEPASAASPSAAEALKLGPELTRIPTRLNSTPQPREARQFFYDDSAIAARRALAAGHTRVSVRSCRALYVLQLSHVCVIAQDRLCASTYRDSIAASYVGYTTWEDSKNHMHMRHRYGHVPVGARDDPRNEPPDGRLQDWDAPRAGARAGGGDGHRGQQEDQDLCPGGDGGGRLPRAAPDIVRYAATES
jgi:hypothetical protein